MAEPGYRFGPFTLSSGDRLLRRGGEVVPLGKRGTALLEILAEAGGQPVSKDLLIERAWSGRIVDGVNLSVQIAHLRKALGTTADGQDWIVTVPRFGYRLASGPAEERSVLPRLAVLPFANLTGDPERQYLADGLVDELIGALSRFRSFAVMSRSTSFSNSSPLSSQGIDYVVEGSLRGTGSDIRIVVTMAGRDGTNLWSDSFNGQIGALLEFQDTIVRNVASIIEPRIQKAELEQAMRKRPSDLAAYDLYLQALSKLNEFTEPAHVAARELLQRAIELEPANGVYLGVACWVAEMRITFGWTTAREDDADRCLSLANRAVACAPDDPATLAHCGLALQLVGKEYDRGLLLIERAADLNPNDPLVLLRCGIAHFVGGSLETALDYLHYAIALQPRGAYEAMAVIAHVYAALGRNEDALHWARRGIAINGNYQPSRWIAVSAAAHLGRMDEAHAALEELLERVPDLTVSKLLVSRPKDNSRDEIVAEGLRLAGLREA